MPYKFLVYVDARGRLRRGSAIENERVPPLVLLRQCALIGSLLCVGVQDARSSRPRSHSRAALRDCIEAVCHPQRLVSVS
jgi:hypothetical protein